jgi:hypothetical protein
MPRPGFGTSPIATCPGLNLEGESLDELYDKLFHGIEEITGEPKVEFELVVLGRRWPALV